MSLFIQIFLPAFVLDKMSLLPVRVGYNLHFLRTFIQSGQNSEILQLQPINVHKLKELNLHMKSQFGPKYGYMHISKKLVPMLTRPPVHGLPGKGGNKASVFWTRRTFCHFCNDFWGRSFHVKRNRWCVAKWAEFATSPRSCVFEYRNFPLKLKTNVLHIQASNIKNENSAMNSKGKLKRRASGESHDPLSSERNGS